MILFIYYWGLLTQKFYNFLIVIHMSAAFFRYVSLIRYHVTVNFFMKIVKIYVICHLKMLFTLQIFFLIAKKMTLRRKK